MGYARKDIRCKMHVKFPTDSYWVVSRTCCIGVAIAEEWWSVFLWRATFLNNGAVERILHWGLFCVLCSLSCISLFLKCFHAVLPLEEREKASISSLFLFFFFNLPLMGSMVQKMFTAVAACDSLWRGGWMTRRPWMCFDCSALIAVSEVAARETEESLRLEWLR